ncbi:MAG TPA: preprotein translocase subunit YajC [Sorangium sp.]|nr:preprotein translocase subunit YajC [Sorangium sp.]
MNSTLLLQPADMQQAPAAAPGPAPAAPAAPGAASTEAPAAPPGQGGPLGGIGFMVAVPLLLVGLMWFMNRGEKKRRAELEEKLKKGDRVLTRSGIVGKVLELGDSKVKIEIAPGVNVTMTKQSIEGLDEGGDVKSSKKSSDKDRDGKKNKK